MTARKPLEDARVALRSARLNHSAGDVRGAGNRAYYAVFYATRDLLEAFTDVDPFTLKTHDGLRRMFELNFIRTGRLDRNAVRLFNDVQQTRWSADYTADMPSADEVLTAIEKAEAFVQVCHELFQQ